jgi:flagellar biosynthetic protein FlhB
MAEQDLDRNEQATPYKLEKAKEKGQVARSTEPAAALVLAVAVVFLNWKGYTGLLEHFFADGRLLAQAGRIDASPANLWSLVEASVRQTVFALAPLFAAMVIAAVVANFVQTGGVFSLEPIKPDFERINPASGAKRIFSMRTLFDAGRAIVKVVVLCLFTYHALLSLTPQFYHLASLPTLNLLRTMVDDVAAVGLQLVLALGLIALVDLAFSRSEFAKKMRMSRKEMTDEHKNREGDPRIRARLRELRREMLKRSQALHRTRSANVVITNPTHYAIALKYEHGVMDAPVLLAKGTGAMARAIRGIANLHGIPVVQNAPLARELFKSMQIDQQVPAAHFSQVARIMVWVLARRSALQSMRRGWHSPVPENAQRSRL